MATFTSVTSGNWNDGATWGLTSPGAKGTDWPGTAGDVVNIGTTAGQSHVVVYNVSETNELGQITINATTGAGASRLEFSTGMNSKLTLGHQDILVNQLGELRVGASGAIIPKTYTAKVIWNTTADNQKGLNVAANGKVTVYGDPDYFGSDWDSVLTASSGAVPTAGNAITITVAGDFTTKWLVGQELLMHKGGSYGTTGYINDFCRLAITGLALNIDGINTDVACTVTERPAALTCAIGADVFNLSRNVMFYKLSYNANLGQYNSNRPKIINNNFATSAVGNINIHDAVFAGWYNTQTSINFGVIFDGVVRNSHAFLSYPVNGSYGGVFAMCNDIYIFSAMTTISATMCATNRTGYGNKDCTLSGRIFGNAIGFYGMMGGTISSPIYACNVGIIDASINNFNGKIGYNADNVQMANVTDINIYSSPASYLAVKCRNVKSPASLVITSRNLTYALGRMGFEHYQQVVDAHYVLDAMGDIVKTLADGSGDNPSQRSGGGEDILEVVPQSNCGATSFAYLELLNVRLYAAAAVSKVYRFYVQTDYATLPAAELKLYGEYLDEGSGGHLATVASTQDITTRSNAADWSQYVEVTINPAQDGFVNLYLRLMGYESGKKVWVDPVVAITGGDAVTITPRWSYGEVELDVDPVAAGGLLTHSGFNGGLNG